MNILPFKYTRNGSTNTYNRLVVEPMDLPEERTPEGLIIPSRHLPGSALGKVFHAAEDSEFKPGDEVQYMQVDRASNENMDSVSIEGKKYDVIYEHKVWAHNDRPYNQIFVRPITQAEITEGGLLLPSDALSVTKKGVIQDAPSYFDNLKKGDIVEYQNGMQGRWPQCTIDGEQHDVIFESDIFTINGEVAPHRIIVKIDMVQQSFKRSTTQSGLKLSPLFIAMLRNLQYGEITGIGEKAKLLYPELNTGDTIIIDHAIESQDYRIVRRELGKELNIIYEHRIINCYDFSDREIFGKLHYDKQTRKIIDITPLTESVFFKWEFDMFEEEGKVLESSLRTGDNDLKNYHNLSDLKNVVGHLRREAAENAKIKVSGIKQRIAYTNKDLEPAKYAALAMEAKQMEREEAQIAAHLRKDHLVVLETTYPQQNPRYLISPYEVLYPINIMGHKFIIGHSDFLLFQTHKKMNIKASDLIALSDNVLVLPIEEKEEESQIRIPDGARQRPQYGVVVKIAENNDIGVKAGDNVLFRQHAGLQQKIDGVVHFIMKQNDLLASFPAENTK